MTSTAARTRNSFRERLNAERVTRNRHEPVPRSVFHVQRFLLFLLLLDREGELRIDVPAVVARAVRQLRAAALGATDVVDRLQSVMRATLALAHLADSLDGLHDLLLASLKPLTPAHGNGLSRP